MFTPQQEGGLMSEGIIYIIFSSVHIFSFSKLLEKRGNYKPFYFLILTTLKRQNVMRDYNISLQLLTPTCVKNTAVNTWSWNINALKHVKS